MIKLTLAEFGNLFLNPRYIVYLEDCSDWEHTQVEWGARTRIILAPTHEKTTPDFDGYIDGMWVKETPEEILSLIEEAKSNGQ